MYSLNIIFALKSIKSFQKDRRRGGC